VHISHNHFNIRFLPLVNFTRAWKLVEIFLEWYHLWSQQSIKDEELN